MGFFSSFTKSVGNVFKKASAPLSLINPGLGIGAGLVGSLFGEDPSVEAQYDINNANLALQREMNQQNQQNWQTQFDYIEQQNNLTREREDNAIQRQVADAKAAGLSPLAVAGTGGASSAVVNSAPSAPAMQAPVLAAPDFQNDLKMQLALLNFAGQAVLQDKDLSSKEKIADMQTSTQKFIAVSQLENAKDIADASNDTQLQIATNQLIELNRSNTAREYQAKLEYFSKEVSRITGGHGRFEIVDSIEAARAHNEEVSIRWAEFVKTIPKDSESSGTSTGTSVGGSLGVNKNNSKSGSKWNPLTGIANSLTDGLGVNGSIDYSKNEGENAGYSQNSSVQALIKSFWLRDENKLWLCKDKDYF